MAGKTPQSGASALGIRHPILHLGNTVMGVFPCVVRNSCFPPFSRPRFWPGRPMPRILSVHHSGRRRGVAHDVAERLARARRGRQDPERTGSFRLCAGRLRRLLGVLYDQGYYSGTISIRIDGHEAAAIAPMGCAGPDRQDRADDRTGPALRLLAGGDRPGRPRHPAAEGLQDRRHRRSPG